MYKMATFELAFFSQTQFYAAAHVTKLGRCYADGTVFLKITWWFLLMPVSETATTHAVFSGVQKSELVPFCLHNLYIHPGANRPGQVVGDVYIFFYRFCFIKRIWSFFRKFSLPLYFYFNRWLFRKLFVRNPYSVLYNLYPSYCGKYLWSNKQMKLFVAVLFVNNITNEINCNTTYRITEAL